VGPPTWLYYFFALVMLAVAAYCIGLVVISLPLRQTAGRDVDVAHVFMGVSMAGMFVAHWAFGPNALWELVFGALTIWFSVRTLQSLQRFGWHVPHHAIHAAMSFAMLLMYWFPMGSGAGRSVSMSMAMGASSAKLDPGLGLLLAMAFFASAIFTLASPVKGASHHGRHGAQAVGSPGSGAVGTLERVATLPWLEDASHVVMCVGMGFMLILML